MRHPGKLAIVLSAAVVALGAGAIAPPLKAAAAAGGSWPQVRYDAARTGSNPTETTINAANVNQLRLAWTFDPQEYPTPSPVVANGVAYLSCQKSKECALDTRTGKLLWTQEIGADYHTSPGALSGGILYVSSDTKPPAKLYALSASTGAILWTASADPVPYVSDSFNSPTVANAVVYAQASGYLYAFNAATGARLFRTWAGTWPEPAFANGTLYGSGQTSTQEGLLKAFSGTTGRKQWNSAPEDHPLPGATVAGGKVYIGPHAYPVACADGCQPAWTFNGPSGSMTQPAVANGVVYQVYNRDGKLYAIDANRGTLLWMGNTGTPGGASAGPVVAGGVVFVVDGATSFDAFNAAGCGGASCPSLWHLDLEEADQVRPVVADGTVFVGSSNQASLTSKVYAYRLGPTPSPPPPAATSYYSVTSNQQYRLSNSDGMLFTNLDEAKLKITFTPTAYATAVVTANADLWTATAGYNQDFGIAVDFDGVPNQTLAWKESGGYGGTFSPNAAALQATRALDPGMPITFRLVWKTNKAQVNGASIFAGAGPINGAFSPTSLSVRIVPGDSVSQQRSAQQYRLEASDGVHWTHLDSSFTLHVTPATASVVRVVGNADLWTETAGVNQDLAILAAVDSAPEQLVAWKESGGNAGTYSPNAAFVQAAYPVMPGHVYDFWLAWKTNKPFHGPGAIHAGAGGLVNSEFSPTLLIAQVRPASISSASSTKQYSLAGSNGGAWAPLDSTSLKISLPASLDAATALLGANADLWTDTRGVNQDIGIFVSANGGLDELVAWKESGGYAGTYSPNAAFVQAEFRLEPSVTYTFTLKWKSNKPSAPGAGIHAGAGPLGTEYSPTSLIADLTS